MQKHEKDNRDRLAEEGRQQTREIYGKFGIILKQMKIDANKVLPEEGVC